MHIDGKLVFSCKRKEVMIGIVVTTNQPGQSPHMWKRPAHICPNPQKAQPTKGQSILHTLVISWPTMSLPLTDTKKITSLFVLTYFWSYFDLYFSFLKLLDWSQASRKMKKSSSQVIWVEEKLTPIVGQLRRWHFFFTFVASVMCNSHGLFPWKVDDIEVF